MAVSWSVSPKRRVVASEEHELLAAAGKLKAAETEADRLRAERDHLIADLLDDNARLVDVAAILGLSPKAVRDAAARARG